MLSERRRVILFWFTIGMIVLVAAVAVVTILRACGRVVTSVTEETPFDITPAEAMVCIGGQQRFSIKGDTEVTWEATGGTISEGGLFTAGDTPGDYTIIATKRDSRQTAEASVHVVACTPTSTPAPSPTPIPTLASTATPTAEAPPPPPTDPQGDVGTYDSGAPVEGVPAGVDIRAASVGSDLRITLQPTEGVPTELAGWTAEDEVLLWIALYKPLPDPPEVYTEWLFALDLDGDTTTGRPVGEARINPDLGMEAAIGVYYDPASGEYVPYLLVWDPAQGSLVPQPDVPRFTLDDSRTLIGLALPLETLIQAVEQTAGVTVVPEAVKGRAAALSYAGEQAVIDFYPDRPE
ncbi:MAG TPA: hypothetical protein G4N97_03345 [Thermoflexia bacterium]|nr:hypothetical protein [Thermoflexia bacterium]